MRIPENRPEPSIHKSPIADRVHYNRNMHTNENAGLRDDCRTSSWNSCPSRLCRDSDERGGVDQDSSVPEGRSPDSSPGIHSGGFGIGQQSGSESGYDRLRKLAVCQKQRICDKSCQAPDGTRGESGQNRFFTSKTTDLRHQED